MKKIIKLNMKLRHIKIHQHWLHQEVQQGQIAIQWLSTAEMPADGLTKSLPAQRQAQFVKQLNLVDISTQLSGNSDGDSNRLSNSSGHSQLDAGPADLKDRNGIAYFNNS